MTTEDRTLFRQLLTPLSDMILSASNKDMPRFREAYLSAVDLLKDKPDTMTPELMAERLKKTVFEVKAE